MRIIETYLFKKTVLGYVFVALGFYFLYIITDVSFKLQDLLNNKTAFFLIIRYYFAQAPVMFVRVTPLAALLSVFYNIGTLNRSNEIMAMRVQGMSILGLARVFLFFGLLLSSVLLLIQDKVIPVVLKQAQVNLSAHNSRSPSSQTVKNIAFYSQDKYIIFAREYDVKYKIFTDVSIFQQTSSGEIGREIIARRLVYTGGRWLLKDASFYKMENNRLVQEDVPFWSEKTLLISEKPQDVLRRRQVNWSGLTLKEIKQSISKFSGWKSSRVVRSLIVEYHSRLAQSLSVFFLILGGLPFALKIHLRRVGLSSLGMAIIFCLIYYTIFSLSIPLGQIGFIFLPGMSPWIANIFFGISGSIGLMCLM